MLTEVEMLKDSPTLVPVPSMMANLRSLTLAVAAGSPVLLQGPVGCGKTSLVQHLAQRVGRNRAPEFMKIQLGDQTDSKVRERERGERGERERNGRGREYACIFCMKIGPPLV